MDNRQMLRGLLKGAIAISFIGGSLTLLDGVTSTAATAQSTRPSTARSGIAIDRQQVPTARYGRGEAVDLSLIVEEWRDRYPDIPVYACSCNADTCGNPRSWPYREFTKYQPVVALGPNNAGNNQATGFNCFDIETGEAP